MATKKRRRNYKQEYTDYHGTVAQRRRRSARNKANKIMNPGPGKEVHHRNKNPLDNRRSNLVVLSKKKNRSIQPKTKTRRKRS